MGKALTYIGGLLLAILFALLLVPRFVDWNNFRGAFEEEASRVLGREVRVGGGFNLRLLPSPYVRFEKLRIADNSGTLGEPFFRAESFTLGLAVAPLLRGALEATHIELKEPVLTLSIDRDGRGNWRDVALSPSARALLPAEIRLQEVDIVDGRVTLKGGDGELLKLDGINGELSADNIDGPYKFRGLLGWHGEQREVRIATARPDADGSVRFKALVKPQTSAASYTLDAKISDIGGKPKFEGDLAARLPLTASAGSASASGAKSSGESESLELRSRITGDAFGLSLPEVLVAFDHGGQPQLLAGEAGASWRDGLGIKVVLNSRWLDLDKLSGSGAQSGPLEAVRNLLPSLVALLPQSAQADVRLSIDQVNLGGEAVSGVRLALDRVRGPIQIRELQLGLPGGTRLELSGALDVQPTETRFSGDLALRATSYARFLGWAAKDQTLVDTRNDGPFAVQGKLGLGGKSIELGDFTGEFLGAPLKGALGYAWGERRRIDVRLEGQHIDVSSLLPGGLDPAQVKALLWPEVAKSPPPAGGLTRPTLLGLVDARSADAHFTVRAVELGDGERILRDVDAALSIEQGHLKVAALRLITMDGVRIDVSGEVSDVAKTPRGRLHGTVAADSTTAVEALLAAFSLGTDIPGAGTGRARSARLERLSPLRLAGTLGLGARGTASTDIAIDGTLNGSRTVARIESDGGPQRWREALLEINATVDNAATGLALSELLVGESGLSAQLEGNSAGQLVLRASGRPDAGMLALASLKGERLAIDLDGRLTLHADAAREFAGVARIEVARAQPLLSLIGLGSTTTFGDLALAGIVDLDARAGTLHLSTGRMQFGGSEITGVMSLSRRQPPAVEGGGPQLPITAVDATLTMPSASMAGLLSPLLERKRVTAAREGQTPLAGSSSTQTWPEAAFDFAALDSIQGRVKLGIGRLALEDGLALTDAALDVELTPGQVKVSNLDGRALGGDFKARLILEKAPLAGVALAGALRIDDANLEAIAGKAAATGTAGLLIQFSGRALSPHALVSAVQGKGEINIGQVQLARISPATVPRAVEAMLVGKAEATSDQLRRLLRDGLGSGGLALPPAKIPMQIAEGAARLQRHPFETADARGSVEITVDLAALKVDSEWRMEAKSAPKPQSAGQSAPPTKDVAPKDRGPLPGISVVYVGPLGSLPALEPRINADALEREVLVRRMERDVEELERLRREDEERYRREQERQRQLEEERRRALESGLPPPPVTPPAGTPFVIANPAGKGPDGSAAALPSVGSGPVAPSLAGAPAPARADRPGASLPGEAPSGQPSGGTVVSPQDGPKRPPRPANAQPPPRFNPFPPFSN